MPKKKNKKELVYYYYDEINDDFAATSSIKRRIIDGSYNYLREDKNILWRIWAGFLHYIIVKPIAHLIMVFGYHYKVVNRKAFKECKKKGCFVYSNHTNYMPDAYIPNLLATKRSYVVVNSSAVSIKGLESFVIALGAIPLADTVDAKKNLLRLLKNRSKDAIIAIYPEAHIWPYYTKIRPFPKASLKYPIMFHTPAYTVTNCYQKRKFGKRPKMVCYIDGPFYPDYSLDKDAMLDKLYEEVYSTMVKRTEESSTYAYRKYVNVDKKEDSNASNYKNTEE